MATRLNNRSNSLQHVGTACKLDSRSVRRRSVTINYRDTLGHRSGNRAIPRSPVSPVRPHPPPAHPILLVVPVIFHPWVGGMGQGWPAGGLYIARFRVPKGLGGGGGGGGGIDIQPPPTLPAPGGSDCLEPAGTTVLATSTNVISSAAAALLSLDSGFSADDECCHRDALSPKKMVAR